MAPPQRGHRGSTARCCGAITFERGACTPRSIVTRSGPSNSLIGLSRAKSIASGVYVPLVTKMAACARLPALALDDELFVLVAQLEIDAAIGVSAATFDHLIALAAIGLADDK